MKNSLEEHLELSTQRQQIWLNLKASIKEIESKDLLNRPGMLSMIVKAVGINRGQELCEGASTYSKIKL